MVPAENATILINLREINKTDTCAVLKATRDRDAWKDKIAYIKEHST